MVWFVTFLCASLARLAMPNPLHLLHTNYQHQIGVLPRFTILVDPEYNCVEAGSFPDKTDCSRFYTCNIIGEKLVVGGVKLFKSIFHSTLFSEFGTNLVVKQVKVRKLIIAFAQPKTRAEGRSPQLQ